MKTSLLFLPGPVPVAQAVRTAGAQPLINHRGPEFAAILERTTKRLQRVFGTSGPVVLLGSSGTGGLEAAVVNAFSPGDKLLACPLGSFGRRFAAIAAAYGCAVETLDTPLGSGLDLGKFTERLRADIKQHPNQKDRFRGVLLTHNETSTGVQNDMSAFAPVLREHGALSLVDSVSGLGATEFRMDEWGYDIVTSASQKAFAAPPGIAMIALGERAIAQMQRAAIPRFYFDIRKTFESADRGQTPWTPPTSIVFGLDAALELYEQEGGPAVWARHEKHAKIIRAGLERLGFPIFSKPGVHSVTIIAAQPPAGVDATQLLETLRVEHGVVLAQGLEELAGKIVRMGTMGDITEDDIQYALDSIEHVIRKESSLAGSR